MNCIIIEDEPLARNLLTEYIRKTPSLTLSRAFANPLEGLDYLHEHPVDVLFLDVQMPELTGISLLKILKQKPIVVLTTAYPQYAIEGYELDVTDYLLKPITFERFLHTVEKITAQQSEPAAIAPPFGESQPADAPPAAPTFMFVKDGRQLIKVKYSDIQYIEGLKDYVRIHTPQRKIMTLQRLKALEEVLPSDAFIRVHHSYIVSIEWIDIIEREKILIGDQFIPVSDTYRKAFRTFIEGHEFKQP